ncbi:hypothetical protein AX17_005297 [Amanita inopinata Kibby_2008]|nr:hypothetical protein AX17_005297 [Amanita inopinata Kibby_2008]
MTSLRDFLLESLAQLPGAREFHLHVLVSAPRRNSTLFIFAQPLPRVYLQDVFILLSEQANPDNPRILVVAIEARVYHIPSTSSVVLYVSKVDTSGQGQSPSPTSTLVRSLLVFYANPLTRPIQAKHLWIHLFARAQAQYLFPNSAEFSGKHPLSDIKLCAWWKRILSEVAEQIQPWSDSLAALKLYYILPGYSEFEASNAINYASLSRSSSSQSEGGWIYGHPYSQTDMPLPCPRNADKCDVHHLGYFIPSFDDDPKSRFLDDIAYTTSGEIKSPARKRSRVDCHGEGQDIHNAEGAKEKKDKEGKHEAPLGELGKVTGEEFWERMPFRQECVSGAVTGFFAVGVKLMEGEGERGTVTPPFVPGPGQVSSQIVKRVVTSLTTGVEFSTVERSIRATETVEGLIKGLCEGIGLVPTPVIPGPRKFPKSGEIDRRTPERESGSLALPSTPPPPGRGIGRGMMAEISPNPFPEPVTSLESYEQYIYGAIKGKSPTGLGATAEQKSDQRERPVTTTHVTVLTVRRKKRRTE